MHALDPTHPPSPFSTRLASLCCITFAFLLHGTHVRWGIRLQNILGLFKFFVLVGIATSGLATLFGLKGFQIDNVRTAGGSFVGLDADCRSIC